MSENKRTIRRTRYRVDDYPEEARDLLESMLQDVRYTYQEIAETLTEKGWPISKSSVHRYARRTQAATERLKVAAEQTRVLIQSIKDGQDVEASEVASALLLDGLINRLATAEEEFDNMPLDKAGRLLVQLQRSGVYKNRWKDERQKVIDGLRDSLMASLRDEVQGDDELLERLGQLVDQAARREAAKDA
jgi:hypothetical protein